MGTPNAIINSDYGQIIININDLYISKHISRLGYWAKDEINLINNIISFLLTKKERVILYDVGANIGTHSLAISKTFNEKIKIRAFEAQRQFFFMLCGTIALNGLNNVYCHNYAVSNESGNLISIPILDYHSKNNFGGLELITPENSDNQHNVKLDVTENIKTITLDSFNEPVDFIKMDIEGMEDKAFTGAQRIINDSRPICFVEIIKTNFEFIKDFFSACDYIGFVKDGNLITIPIEHQIQIDDWSRLF